MPPGSRNAAPFLIWNVMRPPPDGGPFLPGKEKSSGRLFLPRHGTGISSLSEKKDRAALCRHCRLSRTAYSGLLEQSHVPFPCRQHGSASGGIPRRGLQAHAALHHPYNGPFPARQTENSCSACRILPDQLPEGF